MSKTIKELKASLGDYKEAKRIGNNTLRVEYNDGTVAIRLHHTDVVTFLNDGTIVLNSGGWGTNTTKDRINKYSPVGVYQKKYEWFLYPSNEPFFDGINITRDGKVLNPKGGNQS